MVTVAEWGIFIVALLAIFGFLAYVASLWRLPVEDRPKTPTIDRYGNSLGKTENPGFQETENEHHGS